jgi:tetratricopeptide (TPR) repeat protein
VTELERLLHRTREALGGGDDELVEANLAINQALALRPDSVDGWLLKCQVCSATGDDVAALAAAEMALSREPGRAECLYWHAAVLGDLGQHREALRSIESGFRTLVDDDRWLIEDLYYEKVIVLEALGLHDAVIATCEEGLQVCPGSALLRSALIPAERAHVRSSLKVLHGGQG